MRIVVQSGTLAKTQTTAFVGPHELKFGRSALRGDPISKMSKALACVEFNDDGFALTVNSTYQTIGDYSGTRQARVELDYATFCTILDEAVRKGFLRLDSALAATLLRGVADGLDVSKKDVERNQ